MSLLLATRFQIYSAVVVTHAQARRNDSFSSLNAAVKTAIQKGNKPYMTAMSAQCVYQDVTNNVYYPVYFNFHFYLRYSPVSQPQLYNQQVNTGTKTSTYGTASADHELFFTPGVVHNYVLLREPKTINTMGYVVEAEPAPVAYDGAGNFIWSLSFEIHSDD